MIFYIHKTFFYTLGRIIQPLGTGNYFLRKIKRRRTFVKNVSLILNVVLAIAVGVLYYLHFTTSSTITSPKDDNKGVDEKAESVEVLPDSLVIADDTTDSESPAQANKEISGKIAFIDLEEFYARYEFYKQGVKNIERSIENKQNQLISKQKALEEEFMKYQQTAPTLSETYRKTKEQQLMEQEQELFKLRDELQQQQENEFNNFNTSLLKKVDDYVKDLSKKQQYDYVFTYTKGGPSIMVYAKDSLDITGEVVEGLNKAYRKK